jgi:hypothetical protein
VQRAAAGAGPAPLASSSAALPRACSLSSAASASTRPCSAACTRIDAAGEVWGGGDAACPISTGGGTRRVQLVRGEGRGVSTQYEGGGGWQPARAARLRRACPRSASTPPPSATAARAAAPGETRGCSESLRNVSSRFPGGKASASFEPLTKPRCECECKAAPDQRASGARTCASLCTTAERGERSCFSAPLGA